MNTSQPETPLEKAIRELSGTDSRLSGAILERDRLMVLVDFWNKRIEHDTALIEYHRSKVESLQTV
jgi:hypothetical protein